MPSDLKRRQVPAKKGCDALEQATWTWRVYLDLECMRVIRVSWPGPCSLYFGIKAVSIGTGGLGAGSSGEDERISRL